MNTLVGRSRGAVSTAAAEKRRAPGRPLRLLVGTLLLAGAALGGVLLLSGAGRVQQEPPVLNGTWELATLNAEPVGQGSLAGVVRQRVEFRDGRIRGETVVRLGTGGGPEKLPFPDESVDRVAPTADRSGLRTLWSGTYQLDDRRQVTMRIGKAIYFLKLNPHPDRGEIELNQDAILTISGTATYRRALSWSVPSPSDGAPPLPIPPH
jgi:hypothetical protein